MHAISRQKPFCILGVLLAILASGLFLGTAAAGPRSSTVFIAPNAQREAFDDAGRIVQLRSGRTLLFGQRDEPHPDRGSPSSDYRKTSILLARFRGSRIDTSFGNGGVTIARYRTDLDVTAESVVEADDGKIVVLGKVGLTPFASDVDGGEHAIVARFTRDGRLDRSFGAGGYFVHRRSDLNAYELVGGLVVRPDGRVGFGTDLGRNRFAWVQLTRSGRLDRRFGTDGVARPLTNLSVQADDAVSGPNGSVAILGTTQLRGSNRSESCAVVSIDRNGNASESFGIGGLFVADAPSESLTSCRRIRRDAAGRLLIGSEFTAGTSPSDATQLLRWVPRVFRLTTDGRLDPTWSHTGVVDFPVNPHVDIQVSDITPMADGSVIACGRRRVPSVWVFGLDGAPDAKRSARYNSSLRLGLRRLEGLGCDAGPGGSLLVSATHKRSGKWRAAFQRLR